MRQFTLHSSTNESTNQINEKERRLNFEQKCNTSSQEKYSIRTDEPSKEEYTYK